MGLEHKLAMLSANQANNSVYMTSRTLMSTILSGVWLYTYCIHEYMNNEVEVVQVIYAIHQVKVLNFGI